MSHPVTSKQVWQMLVQGLDWWRPKFRLMLLRFEGAKNVRTVWLDLTTVHLVPDSAFK